MNDNKQDDQQATQWSGAETHGEAQHLVVLCVHGLSLLCARRVVLAIKRNPAQLKDDVSLSLRHRKKYIITKGQH